MDKLGASGHPWSHRRGQAQRQGYLSRAWARPQSSGKWGASLQQRRELAPRHFPDWRSCWLWPCCSLTDSPGASCTPQGVLLLGFSPGAGPLLLTDEGDT